MWGSAGSRSRPASSHCASCQVVGAVILLLCSSRWGKHVLADGCVILTFHRPILLSRGSGCVISNTLSPRCLFFSIVRPRWSLSSSFSFKALRSPCLGLDFPRVITQKHPKWLLSSKDGLSSELLELKARENYIQRLTFCFIILVVDSPNPQAGRDVSASL